MRPLALAALALALTGCPRRLDFGPKGEIRDAEELLAAVSAAEAKILTVKGEAKLRVDSPSAKGVVTLFVAVSRPALLHIESLDFFGRPQAVLVSDGERFGLYQAEEGRYYQGPASPQNVSRFLPVVLPPQELVSLLLGQAPRIPHERATLSVDEQAGAYRLELGKGGVTQSLAIDPARHRVLKSLVRGTAAYDLAFEDLQESGSVSWPRKVVLEAAAASTVMELRYKDITLNEAPDLTLFSLSAPPGIPVVEVDASGTPRARAMDEVKP